MPTPLAPTRLNRLREENEVIGVQNPDNGKQNSRTNDDDFRVCERSLLLNVCTCEESRMVATNPSRKVFINLPVRDLKRSMTFFSSLGFTFNPRFTDEKAACMIVSDVASVMLLTVPFFQTFTTRRVCNTVRDAEGLFALSCHSRAEVDEIVNTAISAGGKYAMNKQDHGFMYAWSFCDLDGHHWELIWIDSTTLQ